MTKSKTTKNALLAGKGAASATSAKNVKARGKAADTTTQATTVNELAKSYLQHLEEIDKSPATIFSYSMDLKIARDHFGDGTPIISLTSEKVGGALSNRIVKIMENTEQSLVIGPAISDLATGDYLLLAPRPAELDYKYLATVRLEYDPSAPGHPSSWTPFVVRGPATHSDLGDPFGIIISTEIVEFEFRSFIAPLATGVIGTAEAATTGSTELIFRARSDGNALARVGHSLFRSGSVTIPFNVALTDRQSIWLQTQGSGFPSARIFVLGWRED